MASNAPTPKQAMMNDHKRFLKIKRESAHYRPVCERVKDYEDVVVPRTHEQSEMQAARCMDCGTPFCHWGCPVGNLIPEWNQYVFKGEWKKAFDLLNETHNLPEMTGRVCPAPCEYACVLGVNDDAVTIRENELAIIETAFKKGYIKPQVPKKRTGKRVAVVGSGPAGLAVAQQLNRAGHEVTVYEKDDRIGGILRYGIPDFKLEKWVIDRRVTLLEKEGIQFKAGVTVGKDLSLKELKAFDAVCLTGGSRAPRDIPVEGRNLKGIYFAMEYLTQSNRRVAGDKICAKDAILAKGKKVVVIGGGDTGSDCIGTANRQGAACVVQIEVMPEPPQCRPEGQPWPRYPMLLKNTSSHLEGSQRQWTIMTKKFTGEKGVVKKIHCVRVDFSEKDAKGCPLMREIPGSDFIIEADMVVIAIGFMHPEHKGLVSQLGLTLDPRGNVQTNDRYETSEKGIFSAGDMRRGQSLIVWAVSEGRKAAHAIDTYLMGKSYLPTM